MQNARTVLAVTGADAEKFLQDLVTNNVSPRDGGLVYAALLTPQGKYFADFFLLKKENGFLLDVHNTLAEALKSRLMMYKLRANVAISDTPLFVHVGLGEPPADGHRDPRHTAMGWRAYRDTEQTDDNVNWTAIRIGAMVPETGIELGPDSYILEMGFERLHGVDFRKGCYVGQEVTARMKHKTELRKGLARVSVSEGACADDDITVNGKSVGTLHSVDGDQGLAYVRFDRVSDTMQAGTATLRFLEKA